MFPHIKDKGSVLNDENPSSESDIYKELPYLLLDAAKQWESGFESYEEVIKALLDAMLEMQQENDQLEKQLRDIQNKVTSKEFEMVQYKAALIKLENTERSEHKLKTRVQALEARLKRQEDKIKTLKQMGDAQYTRDVLCQTDLSGLEARFSSSIYHPSPGYYQPEKRPRFETPPFDNDDDSSCDMLSVGNEIETFSENELEGCNNTHPFNLHIDLSVSSQRPNYIRVLKLPNRLSPIPPIRNETEEHTTSNHDLKPRIKKKYKAFVVKREFSPSESLDVMVVLEKLNIPPQSVLSFKVERIEDESFVTENLVKNKSAKRVRLKKRLPKYTRFPKRRMLTRSQIML